MLFKKQKGFTLIELLVVISIIGLLASIVLVSLNGARSKARDAKRKMDLKQMQTALALYYDSNSQYPNCVYANMGNRFVFSTDADWNTTGCLITALKPYMLKLPSDPTNNTSSPWTTGNYSYAYTSKVDLQDYDLVAQLEIQTDNDRCQIKQWLFHYLNNVAAWCSPTYGYTNYLYADH
jgi:type II secretion system protein G